MTNSKISKVLLFAAIAISCNSVYKDDTKQFCGYKLLQPEYQKLQSKIEMQKSAYEVDSVDNIYDQLNDSIRAAMPDSIEFEVFLSLLSKDEVGIDVIMPRIEKYFEKIGCAVMNSNFTSKMPEQRYLCLYSYTNPDGSGDSPLEVALKRKK